MYLLFPQPLFSGPTAVRPLTPDAFKSLVEDGPSEVAWLVRCLGCAGACTETRCCSSSCTCRLHTPPDGTQSQQRASAQPCLPVLRSGCRRTCTRPPRRLHALATPSRPPSMLPSPPSLRRWSFMRPGPPPASTWSPWWRSSASSTAAPACSLGAWTHPGELELKLERCCTGQCGGVSGCSLGAWTRQGAVCGAHT